MSERAHSRKKLLFTASLLFTTLVMMSETPLTPASDILYKTFPETAAVDLLLTIPTLTAMFASVFCGLLMMKVDKKKILLLGVACFCIGGICGHLFDSITYMTVMRAILGIGLGSCNVSAIAIASEHAENDSERQKLLSLISAGISISAMLLTFFGGQIVERFGWQAVFSVYWVGIPMLLMVIFFVPSSNTAVKTADESANAETTAAGRKGNMGCFFAQSVLQFFWFMAYGIVFFQIAVYLAERGTGSAALAGTMSAVCNLIAFISGLAYPAVFKRLRICGPALHYITLALGFMILWIFSSAVSTAIASAFLGFGFGYAMCFYSIHLGELVDKSREALAATVFSAIMGIGMFLSTFAVSLLKQLLNADMMTELLPLITAFGALGAICSILARHFETKQY